MHVCLGSNSFFILSMQKGTAAGKDRFTISPSLKNIVFMSLFLCFSVSLCRFPFHLCLSVEKGVEAASEGGRPTYCVLLDGLTCIWSGAAGSCLPSGSWGSTDKDNFSNFLLIVVLEAYCQ